jgi:alanyl aminopeptidase
MLSTFLDQSGEPVVSTALACPKGAAPRLELEQRRNVLAGEKPDDRRWQLPVCVRAGTGKQSARTCTVLSEPRGTLELPGACPAWVHPNAGATGYYRVQLAPPDLAALLKNLGQLTLAERIGLLGDLGALAGTGALPAGDALAALPRFSPAGEAHLAEAGVRLLASVRRQMLPPESRPAFARYIQRTFGPRARQLGFTRKPGEGDAEMDLRKALVPLVADVGQDASLRTQARTLALRWLDDHKSVDPDLAGLAVMVAGGAGDRAFFDRVRAALLVEKDAGARQRMIAALGSIRDPALLLQGLDSLLDPKLDIRESMRALGLAARRGELNDELFIWIQKHFDVLFERVPKAGHPYLIRFGSTLCDEKSLADFQTFMQSRVEKIAGGQRIYENVLESVRSCIAVRRTQAPSVAAFLKKNAF